MPNQTGPRDEATQTFYFFGFGAGEYGAQAGHLVGFRLLRQTLYYAGAFTARNVLRYIDGSLGPRTEAQDITPTGLPAARCFGMGMGTAPGVQTPSSPVTQYLWGMYSNGAPGSTTGAVYRIPLQAGGTAKQFAGPLIPVPQSGAGTTTIINSQFSNPTVVAPQTTAVPDFGGMIQSVAIGNTVYLTSQGNGFYVLLFDPQFSGQAGVVGFVGNANTPGSVYPDGYPLCLYGTFMVGTRFSQPNQLVFSADSNYLDWSTTPGHGAFLDVGDEAPIVGLFPTRHGLYIAKSTAWPMLGGNISPTFHPDEWWLMTGTPGAGATCRKILEGPAATNDSGVVLGDGTIGYLAPGASQGSAPMQMTPAVFTGTAIQSFRYLTGAGQFTLANYAGFDGWMPKAVRLREPHDWMTVPPAQTVAGLGTGFVRKDGIWTKHDNGTVGSGGLYGTNVTAVSDPQNDRVFLATALDSSSASPFPGGTGFQTPAQQHIQVWSAYVEQPTNGTVGQVDPSQCTVTLPEWTSRVGGDVAVSAVRVDFKIWATSGTPTFNLTLLPMRPYGQFGSGDQPSQTMTVPPLPVAISPPMRYRYVFKPGFNFGNAYQLTFTNLTGVSIEKVEVEYAIRPSQG